MKKEIRSKKMKVQEPFLWNLNENLLNRDKICTSHGRPRRIINTLLKGTMKIILPLLWRDKRII